MPEKCAERLFKWATRPKHFCVVHGEPGVGKTFVTAAVINYMAPGFVNHVTSCVNGMRYWSEADLLERVRSSMDRYRDDYVRSLKLYIEEPLLFFDDLGSTGVTEWRKEVVFETIDYRYQNELPTWITTNLSQKEVIRDYGERTASRLFASENTSINLVGEDLRQHGL